MLLTLLKTLKIPLIVFIVVAQLLTIASLGFIIYHRKTKVLGTEVFIPIKKESLTFNPNSKLEYFYEPKANSLDIVNPWVPYKATYTINSDSLNERFDYTPEKPDKTYRIITLGDSFTYGIYVDTENNYSEQLETLLNNTPFCNKFDKFEVINLGVGGYDIQYSSERYRIRGQKYNPDLVIWFIKDDDLDQINELVIPEEKNIGEELRKSGEFDKLIAKGEFYPSLTKAIEQVVFKYGWDNILELQNHFLQEFRDKYTMPLLLITFSNTTDRNKEFLDSFASTHPYSLFHDEIPNIYGVKGISFPNDGHPTISGHEIIAKDIFRYLTKENLIPCD